MAEDPTREKEPADVNSWPRYAQWLRRGNYGRTGSSIYDLIVGWIVGNGLYGIQVLVRGEWAARWNQIETWGSLFSLTVAFIWVGIRRLGTIEQEIGHQWQDIKDSADIVIHLKKEILPFRKVAIAVCQQLFLKSRSQQVPQRKINALDFTEPGEWWANDMLGYLAAQSQWIRDGGLSKKDEEGERPARSIHRVFVWTPSQISSPLGTKLLIYHVMLGFHTYVLQLSRFQRLCVNKALHRDVLFWDDGKGRGIQLAETHGDDGVGYVNPRRHFDPKPPGLDVSKEIKDLLHPLSRNSGCQSEYCVKSYVNLLRDAMDKAWQMDGKYLHNSANTTEMLETKIRDYGRAENGNS